MSNKYNKLNRLFETEHGEVRSLLDQLGDFLPDKSGFKMTIIPDIKSYYSS